MGATSSRAGRRRRHAYGRADNGVPSWIPVSQVMAGDHVCLVTGDELERREVVSTYVKQGLDGKDRVLCFFSEARADSMFDFLEADTRQRLVSTGQLGVASTAESFMGNGRFHPEAVLEQLSREVDATIAAGWRGLRVTGDMWVFKDSVGPQALVDWELGLSNAIPHLPVSAICEYDLRYGADLAGRCLELHPRRAGVDPWRSHGAMRVFRSFEPPGLRVEGSVDANSGFEFAAALVELIDHADDNGDTHMDLSELKFIDLDGLRELAWTASQLPEGRRLVLHHLAPHHRDLITLLRWNELPELCLDWRRP